MDPNLVIVSLALPSILLPLSSLPFPPPPPPLRSTHVAVKTPNHTKLLSNVLLRRFVRAFVRACVCPGRGGVCVTYNSMSLLVIRATVFRIFDMRRGWLEVASLQAPYVARMLSGA